MDIEETRFTRIGRLAMLLAANGVLALGPWLVRLADTGPVAAGFWRLTLAFPLVALLAWKEPAGRPALGRSGFLMVIGAGVFFALDLAAWHLGIERTRLGNATLFGNAGSVILIAWGLVAARQMPRVAEIGAICAALVGAFLLMDGSLQISHENLVGDLFSLLAGLFYAFYLLMLRSVRARLGPWGMLAMVTAAGAPVALFVAVVLGETVWPSNWTPLLVLAFSSQIVGQGLLIRSLSWFSPVVIGLALLTQPAISALTGFLAFGEMLSLQDLTGMALMGAALALARAAEPRARAAKPRVPRP
ncbi:MAG: EamA family transporter [Croceicoccus sp.]|nr:EamA family transporter [Croceicoccus sp.]MAL25188.1 EamA family transporter [Croceicoccus sp.]|tara:strand:- start:85607 stop:86515 length:909 start_codon:yes stop_codon:yes gene_type:complete